jgi:hypothetical protein
LPNVPPHVRHVLPCCVRHSDPCRAAARAACCRGRARVLAHPSLLPPSPASESCRPLAAGHGTGHRGLAEQTVWSCRCLAVPQSGRWTSKRGAFKCHSMSVPLPCLGGAAPATAVWRSRAVLPRVPNSAGVGAHPSHSSCTHPSRRYAHLGHRSRAHPSSSSRELLCSSLE